MPERRVKVPLPNGQVGEGYDVPVAASQEQWSEVTLEDGTILRVKAVVSSAIRIDSQWDPEGNPLYAVKSGQAIVIVSVPPELKRKVQ
jgi:hypothetical protein